MADYRGVTIELIGDSGSGKTTQGGELAKYVFSKRRKRTILHTCDRGGYDSIAPLERAGLISVDEYGPEDDPWIWVDSCVNGSKLKDDTGLVILDSGSSMSDLLMEACHKSEFQIGQQRTQKFAVSRGKQQLTVSINNEAHYGVVQGFMLESIRKSSWMTRRGVDVLWTFVLWRGEAQDRSLILGPKLAGKALTPFIPKEFRYTFRISSIPIEGQEPMHRLYLTEHPELAGLGHSFGNARYPLGVTPLPPYLEPASIAKALELIEEGQHQADNLLKAEGFNLN